MFVFAASSFASFLANIEYEENDNLQFAISAAMLVTVLSVVIAGAIFMQIEFLSRQDSFSSL
jgi:sensor histidine kinase regulating citrate/malate metabolism